MNVTIRKLEEKDIANKIKWINDERNNRFLHYDLPLEYEKTLDWYNRNKGRSDRFDAVIEYNGLPVGIIGLLNIDKKCRKAEIYITIGEHELKGKGIAKEATKLLLNYAFDTLDLNKVYLFTEKDNVIAQKLFERLGFIKEGLLHDDVINRDILVSRYVYAYYKRDHNQSGATSWRKYYDPTPIYRLNFELNGNTFFIKRDDLYPISFGGNKARKALLYFSDIASGDYDCVVTYGSNSSNHCRVIANLAASKNLPCHIISSVDDGKESANRKLSTLLGAYVTYCNIAEVSETIDEKIKELKDNGFKPYFIMGGGHGNIGTQAYVDCYEEICCYEELNNIKFDYIFLASGTGTTQAGLVCGQILRDDFNRRIIGISIARRNPYGGKVVLDSVNDYLISKGMSCVISDFINFIDDYVLNGYGTCNSSILRTIKQVLVQDGIPLDTTYTGKAFWGMLDYIRKIQIRDKNILFIHTGGTPLFFDKLEELVNGV